MVTSISLTGRVTADLELMTSASGSTYLPFSLAVDKGFGEHQHTNYFQCVLFGKAADRCLHAGVHKGSPLFITGDLDIIEFTRRDGTKGFNAKITVYDWCYVPANKKAGSEAEQSTGTTDSFMDVEDCGENGLPY